MLVIDVGNSRTKWGLCDASAIRAAASLPLDEPAEWQRQWATWRLSPETACVVAGVNPPVVHRLSAWLAGKGAGVRVLDSFRELPLKVGVERPEGVGLDRLLNAVAAKEHGGPAIVVDAGSAVTVDWLDENDVFRGGAIFPGLRLMAQALHQHTAKLPLVELSEPPSGMPGTSTEQAMAAGIHGSVVGGIVYLVQQIMQSREGENRREAAVQVTGGNAELLARALRLALPQLELWPWMTLEGIRLSAGRPP